jgi:hypothetical protein
MSPILANVPTNEGTSYDTRPSDLEAGKLEPKSGKLVQCKIYEDGGTTADVAATVELHLCWFRQPKKKS